MRKLFISVIFAGILLAWSQSGWNYLNYGEFRWITLHDALFYSGILPIEQPITEIGKFMVKIGNTIGEREIGQVGVFALILINIPFWWKTARPLPDDRTRKGD